jgi:hypothetical protein
MMETTARTSLRSSSGSQPSAKRQFLRMLWTALLLAGATGLKAQAPLTQSDLYCAGFLTQRPIERGLFIQGSEDGGFKNEFATGDYVYLSLGRNAINGTGGQYTIIRPVSDVNAKEAFEGQKKLVRELGTLYAEIGRLEVTVLHDRSATGKILMACDSIYAGDILIPFNAKTVPPFKTPHVTDRFAPTSGNVLGKIVAAREFDIWLGESRIVYLNVGSAQGVRPGSYFYVTRPYLSGPPAEFAIAAQEFLTDFMGVQMGRKLTLEEQATMPREVLGEVMVLTAEEGTATGIITYSRAEISPGDSLEMQ